MDPRPAGVEFHDLVVDRVVPETDESVSITFEVPDHLAGLYRFRPGQHLVVRAEIDGVDVRRSYSICANANTGDLRIGVKRLPGGVFSTFATTALRPGMTIGVAPPTGDFTITPDPDRSCHYSAVAAGSGITPVLSLISTTLESEPAARWTLIFGNRTARSVMFLEDLESLKDRYPDRFHLIHVLSREDTGLPITSGRIDRAKLAHLLSTLIDPLDVDEWFLCGPFELVETARALLRERGVAAGRLHDELFFAGPPDPDRLSPTSGEEQGAVGLTFTLEGRATSTRMDPATSILDAALRVRRDLPFSCKGGMCASCKARLIEGTVEMRKNYALVDAELDTGYVLTCQSHPTSDAVVVDFDQR